jgi:hypothetical protein
MVNAVFDLVVAPDGSLFAGGNFWIVDSGAAFVAQWDGTIWRPLKGGVDRDVHALALQGESTLVLGGDFTLAGSIESPYITLYTPSAVGVEMLPATLERIALVVGPNPSVAAATVRVTLPVAGLTEISVHDVLGRRVATLAEGVLGVGVHTLRWETSGLAPGVYVVRAVEGDMVETARVSVVR